MVTNVTRYLDQRANISPNNIAYASENEMCTFDELRRHSRIIASILIEKLNGQYNRPIAIFMPKSVKLIKSFIAVAYSGNFYTPLDTDMPSVRLQKILDILQPDVIIADAEHIAEAERLCASSHVICIDEINVTDELNINNTALDAVQLQFLDSNPLYVLFTSGSTGTPKGVVISHRAAVDFLEWIVDEFSLNEKTVVGNQAPFYFDLSLLDAYAPIFTGGITWLIPSEYFLFPKRLYTFLGEKNVNTILWSPSALVLLANSHIMENKPIKTLKNVFFCGEVMPVKQLNYWKRLFPQVVYVNFYGPTECTMGCTYYVLNRDFADNDELPIGTPCGNTEIILLDSKNRAVQQGGKGEICVRGACLANGYYRNHKKTREAFIQNPLRSEYCEMIYRTGDIGWYNNYGELMYAGRKDFQIKHLGYRIELGEIETAASSFAEIDRVCVLYDSARQIINLFVEPEKVNSKLLYAYLKEQIPHYMLPGRIVCLKRLPLNRNGKIDRIKLKQNMMEGF